MTRAAVIRFPVEPRLVPPAKIARRLGLTPSMFDALLPQLEAQGFPTADTLIGNYCLQAVDKWIDARAGLTRPGEAVSDPSLIMERIRNRAWAG